jgi:hypothetical protein
MDFSVANPREDLTNNVVCTVSRLQTIKFLYCNIYPTRCNVTQCIFLETALHVSGGTPHPSSGEQTTVSTASGICHTVMYRVKYQML